MMNAGRADSPVPHMEDRSESPFAPPTQLLWFEFLLKPGLLETHLNSDNPEPPGTQLLEQFVDQSIKEANNEECPSQLRKVHSLKVLALKVAAHFKWDFTLLQSSLPLYMVHKVLKDFVEWVSPPELNIQPSTDVCSLDDSVLVALTIYNRWSVRTFVERAVPSKLIKTPAANIPSAFNIAGVNDMVMKTVKDTLPESLNFLERCLVLNRDVFFPDIYTFVDIDVSSPTTPQMNSSPEKLATTHHQSTRVTKEEFLWQLNFDLGCYSFHQQQYGKAADMFQRVQELMPTVHESFYCKPDVPKLHGYLAACSSLIGHNLIRLPSKQVSLLSKCETSKSNNFQNIVQILLEDNKKQELSVWYRECLGQQIARSAITSPQTKTQVALCNAARWSAEGRSVLTDLQPILLQARPETGQFFIECVSNVLSSSTDIQKSNIKSVIRALCRDQILNQWLLDSVLGALFSSEEQETLKACHKTTHHKLTAPDAHSKDKPLDNAGLQMGKLELQLLLTQDPVELENVLRALHQMAPNRRFSAVCSKWQIDKSYGYIIDSTGNRLMQDYLFILLVKAQLCIEKKNYDMAISNLEAACKATKDVSFRLYTGMRNEILYVELLRLAEQRGAMTVGQDFNQRVLACLMGSRGPNDRDIPPRDPVLDQCVLFLLNSQYWLCFFNADIPMPYWRIGKLVALCMRDDPSDLNKCRAVAKDLSSALVQIFSPPPQTTKRNNQGGPVATMNRDNGSAFITRAEFINFVKSLYDDRCLTLLLSCLVKLYNILKDDAANEISHDYPALWPNTIIFATAVNNDSVASTMAEVLAHALAVDPKNPSYLITQADVCYAKKQFGAALKYYLQACLAASRFFDTPVPRGVWTDQVNRRCIKACSGLQCHTQAAILCQFLQPVDYVTAFQSLQEKRCYDGCDALYDCFWDMAILEFLVYNHHKKNEMDKKQAVLQVLSQPELNTCNSETVLAAAAQKRQQRFLQSMAKQYL